MDMTKDYYLDELDELDRMAKGGLASIPHFMFGGAAQYRTKSYTPSHLRSSSRRRTSGTGHLGRSAANMYRTKSRAAKVNRPMYVGRDVTGAKKRANARLQRTRNTAARNAQSKYRRNLNTSNRSRYANQQRSRNTQQQRMAQMAQRKAMLQAQNRRLQQQYAKQRQQHARDVVNDNRNFIDIHNRNRNASFNMRQQKRLEAQQRAFAAQRAAAAKNAARAGNIGPGGHSFQNISSAAQQRNQAGLGGGGGFGGGAGEAGGLGGLGGAEGMDPTAGMEQQAAPLSMSGGMDYGPSMSFSSGDSTPITDPLAGLANFADGGEVMHPAGEVGFYSEGGLNNRYVRGAGDGTSDDVPAMLAAGEFVIPADVVASLGNGDNKAGAEDLDRFMEVIREHKTSNGDKGLPPDSKGALSYIKIVQGKK